VAFLQGLFIPFAGFVQKLIDDARAISINLQAVPSFEAFGRFIEAANPFAFWLQAAQMAWFPWLETARTVMLPWGVAPRPKIGSGDSHRTPG